MLARGARRRGRDKRCRRRARAGSGALREPMRRTWMRRGDFHSTLPVWSLGEIRTGYTCNVLLQDAAPAACVAAASTWRSARPAARTPSSSTMCTVRAADRLFAGSPGGGTGPRRAGAPGMARKASLPFRPDPRAAAEGKRRPVRPRRAISPSPFPRPASAPRGLPSWSSRADAALLRLRAVMHAGVVGGLLGLREIHQYGALGAQP